SETVRPLLSFQSQGSLLGAGPGRGWPLAFVSLLSLLAFRRRRRLMALVVAFVALLTIGSVSGCSGTMYAPTTPNGSYAVTVTGKSQTATASTTVTFTVQN